MNPAPHIAIVVLALDTSTPVLSAAVGTTDRVHELSVEAGRHTGALVPKVVADVLAEAGVTATELTAVAVGVGPGPYTSLRAGIMFAEAAAAALEIPVIGACSLDITARGETISAAEPGEFVVAADARRREVYWARYAADGRRVVGPRVDPRSEREAHWIEGGTPVVTTTPSAAHLASWVVAEYQLRSGTPALASIPEQWVAATSDAANVQIPQTLLTARPLYLRRPDVMEPAVTPPATPPAAQPAAPPAAPPASPPPAAEVRP